MPDFSWLASEDALSNEALTVVAQTIDPTDRGRIRHDIYFPRRDVESVKLTEISDVDFRPASDRREWNQRGRKGHIPTPSIKELEMVPIEATFAIDEYEQQPISVFVKPKCVFVFQFAFNQQPIDKFQQRKQFEPVFAIVIGVNENRWVVFIKL